LITSATALACLVAKARSSVLAMPASVRPGRNGVTAPMNARQAHHRNDSGIAPEFCRNELLHPVNEVRQSRPITYLFTHAVTSNLTIFYRVTVMQRPKHLFGPERLLHCRR
jgi:hypothetical protein